jgi:hypothetical protein
LKIENGMAAVSMWSILSMDPSANDYNGLNDKKQAPRRIAAAP